MVEKNKQCPKCKKNNAEIGEHPEFPGGAYLYCHDCGYIIEDWT